MTRLIKDRSLLSEVANFGEGEVTVYWRPMSLGEMGKISAANETSSVAGIVESLLIRARKADGSRMFDHRDGHPDRAKIENDFDPDEVIRIVAAMSKVGESGN